MFPIYIGKESNKVEEVEYEDIHDPDKVLEKYSDPKYEPWFTLVVPILKLLTRERLARLAGIEPRSIQALRNAHRKPSSKTRAVLTRAAADYARALLNQEIRDDLCACATFVDCSL